MKFSRKLHLTHLLFIAIFFVPITAYPQTKIASLPLSMHIFAPVKFIPHVNTSHSFWLARNINYQPVSQLFAILQKYLHPTLIKNRGEAHITVITPPEYQTILRPYLKPSEIDKIALAMRIQSAKFSIICLGKGTKYDAKTKTLMSTYFIVVKSKALLQIRKRIYQLYVARGGAPSRFDPSHFTPHITVGYTNRDLFEADGVFKAKNACYLPLRLVE